MRCFSSKKMSSLKRFVGCILECQSALRVPNCKYDQMKRVQFVFLRFNLYIVTYCDQSLGERSPMGLVKPHGP